jgi:hypothetical protein
LRSEAKDLLTDKLFHSLHFTDMNARSNDDSNAATTPNSEKVIKFTFYHPSDEKGEYQE